MNQKNNLKTPNSDQQVYVTPKDLPLACPMPNSTLWNSHPKVFLPIEEAENNTISCYYCGTQYILKD